VNWQNGRFAKPLVLERGRTGSRPVYSAKYEVLKEVGEQTAGWLRRRLEAGWFLREWTSTFCSPPRMVWACYKPAWFEADCTFGT
jgi:hypothetical protein